MVSIIIPIYNAERYLKKCLDSVLAQSYQDFEVILVNDGSSDNSEQILEDYCKEYEQLKVFSQKNSGVSEARNLGIRKAKGEYIVFIDSDDYVLPNYIECLVKDMEQNPCDLIIHGFDKISLSNNENLGAIFPSDTAQRILLKSPIDVLENDNSIFLEQGYPVSKLFKRNIIVENNILFPKGISIYEDTIFLLQYLYHCQEVYLNHIANYIYVIRSNSASNTSRSFKQTFESLDIMTKTIQNYFLKKIEFSQFLKYNKCIRLLATYINDAIISIYTYTHSKTERESLLSQFTDYQKAIYIEGGGG
ncbi:glycosyltransferase family 2 protein [Ornithobacterium rhinotracheale]